MHFSVKTVIARNELLDHSEEFGRHVSRVLGMRNARVEIDRIALIQDEFVRADYQFQTALQNNIELLAIVSHQRGWLLTRLKRHNHRLHRAPFEIEGQTLEVIFRITAHLNALPRTH